MLPWPVRHGWLGRGIEERVGCGEAVAGDGAGGGADTGTRPSTSCICIVRPRYSMATRPSDHSQTITVRRAGA